MKDRKQALTDLLRNVEAGDDGSLVLPDFKDVFDALTPLSQSKHNAANAWDACHRGSLDAAKALHEAVLPGWGWHVRQDKDGAYGHVLYPSHAVSPGGATTGNNPARAWLIAILKALIAEEKGVEVEVKDE